ncbi:MAG TPA: helical backbone metal receptor [Candidatus Methanomethylophilaceae archaeon]|nr:helical backbone metal receptor [Candidatus Methanomethylophilaceae archaeon]
MDRSTKIKTLLSAFIVIIALTLVSVAPVGLSYASVDTVLILDFGNKNTFYGIIDDPEETNAREALDIACSIHGFPLEKNENAVISINNVKSDTDGNNWNLYVVFKTLKYDQSQEYLWERIVGDPHNVLMGDYAAVSWAFCSDLEVPSRAVDATGMGFYGYGHPENIISLSPSCTEMICTFGGERKIIGTDDFSNYPLSVDLSRKTGKIASIGGFTNPNYETIISLTPDLVICIDSQFSHVDIAKKLRSVGINVLVIDGGEDIDLILESLLMVGTAMGIRDAAKYNVQSIDEDLSLIREKVDGDSSAPKHAMISLSADRSPWVSGSGTYISDILKTISVGNFFNKQEGWVMINSEFLVPKDTIPIVKIDYIIVIIDDGPNTQGDYEHVFNSLGDEWKKTEAYKNKDIYFLTDSAADLASRPGPRVAQLNELLARIIQNTAFEGDMPKFIGNDYSEYLSLTKDPVMEGSK